MTTAPDDADEPAATDVMRWDAPPPGCWPTVLQAARLRLLLAKLLHPRLSASARCRVFGCDGDVVASVGAEIVGRAPLVFTRAPWHGTADLARGDGLVRGDGGGRGTVSCGRAPMRSGVHYAEFSLLAGEPRGIRLGIVRESYVPRRGHWATDSHWGQEIDDAAGAADAQAAGTRLHGNAHSAGWCFDPSAGKQRTPVRGRLEPKSTRSPYEGAPRHLAQTFICEECEIGDRIGLRLTFCSGGSLHQHGSGSGGGGVSPQPLTAASYRYDEDVQVELTVFRNGDELGALLLRDLPLNEQTADEAEEDEEGLCWAVQYTSDADVVRIRSVDPSRQAEQHRWVWSTHWIASMGSDWLETLSKTRLDSAAAAALASAAAGGKAAGLHAVESYPGVDISLLWSPDLCIASAKDARRQAAEQQQEEVQELERVRQRSGRRWLALSASLVVAVGVFWSGWLDADGGWLAMLSAETSRMVKHRLSHVQQL